MGKFILRKKNGKLLKKLSFRNEVGVRNLIHFATYRAYKIFSLLLKREVLATLRNDKEGGGAYNSPSFINA